MVARMALMLLPPRPITLEMAFTGTCTFLHVISGTEDAAVVVLVVRELELLLELLARWWCG